MKSLKTIGVAAVMAAAMLALVGASSASAATPNLCKANESTCSAGNTYPAGTAVVGKLESGKEAILTGALELKCKASEVKGIVNPGGTGEITGASWTSCSPSCTVTAESLPWKATYAASGGGNGTMTVSSPKVKIQCSFISCTFTATSVVLDVTGGSGGSEAADPKINASKEPLTSGCGAGSWTAPYRVTSIGGTANAPGFITG
jgi:hypothetical protein